jgi:phospholipid/cholesterol/gamma-HCH transport system ATP-binding protein
MYDEPFTGQDPIAMGVLVNLIRRLNQALGHTSIIVSHDIKETLGIADYVYVVADGRVVAQGSPEDLAGVDSDKVRQFMQGLPDGPVPFHYPAPDYLQELLQDIR